MRAHLWKRVARAVVVVAVALLALIAAALVPLFSGGQPAHAATIAVNTTDDELNADGDCSLREAIQAANTDAAVDACPAGSGADTIVVPTGTYTLSIPGAGEDANATGDLDITADLTLSGADAATTIIDGAALDRVFHIVRWRSLGCTVEISGMTIRNGSPDGSGGGILNQGTLALDSSTVSGNTAPGGGGLFNDYWGNTYPSTSTLTNVTFSGNSASQFSGGGVANGYFSSATLTNVMFSGNSAPQSGGGMSNDPYSSATLTNVTFTGNSAFLGGGMSDVYAYTTSTLSNVTFSGNTGGPGGGMYIRNSTSMLSNVTFTGNYGLYGGGMFSRDSTSTLTNVTFSSNTAFWDGGGMANVGSSSSMLTNVTFSGNSLSYPNQRGGGIVNGGGGTLKNTIVANNSPDDCAGSITSLGHNLSSDGTCGLTGSGDLQNTDPMLGLLADNGGHTQTHALLGGSPAIDAGSPDCPPPATDQRGVARPQGAACDIGAFELVADSDGDGVLNAEDACLTTPGLADRQGCPVGDANTVTLHVVDQAKAGACPGGAGSCESPIAGAQVRVFDRNAPAFQTAYSKNASGSLYGTIFEAGTGQIASCTTDPTGQCTAGEETTGEYLAIVKYVDSGTGKTVYTGKPKSPEDFVDGIASKEFQILKIIRKDGGVQYSGGSKTVVSGSYLEIVYPEFAVWEDLAAGYVYPFIFTSDSDWGVNVCAYVPRGYAIVGVYDESNNLISDSRCTQTFLTGETKVVAYEVVDVGSPEPKLDARLKLKHQGKVTTLDLSVPGIRKARQHAPRGPLTGDLLTIAPALAMACVGLAGLWRVRRSRSRR